MSNTTFADPNDDDFLDWMNDIINEVEDFDYLFDDDFDYDNFLKGTKEFSNDAEWN